MLEELLRGIKVFPAVVLDHAERAVPLARVLREAGIGAMEITFRTPSAATAIELVRAAEPSIVVGAGTLRTPLDIERAREAGAQFGVSPGATPELISALRAKPLPWLAGAATASEAMVLAESGFSMLKLFPASLALVDALAGPLPDVRWVPTGGVDASNLVSFLSRPNVAAVSGTWIAPRAMIADGDFASIEHRAREAKRLADQARPCL